MRFIDSHVHLIHPKEKCEKDLLRSMDAHNVEYGLLSSCKAEEFNDETDEPNSLDQISAHQECLDIARRHPGRFGTLLWIRPHLEKVTPELISFIEKNRDLIFGLKFHPYTSRLGLDNPLCQPYLEIMRKFDFPILVHTALDEASTIAHLVKPARENPDLKFVAAHFEMMSDHEYCINALRELPNVYGDTAWVDMESALKAMDELGEDHVLFGTDNPVDGDTLDQEIYRDYFANSYGLDDDRYAKLMRENAINLFKLPLK